ncbi:AarF/ABC1/UbiB kinase family protein [Candidatus Woesearchaeota archaeon]|nr:AarF/ABC1/UbiB kinase family protein [Candidatus Woesearchaeota archaeon]
MPFHLIREVRDIKRFNQILLVLFEEGFDFLLSKIRLKHRIPITKRVKSKLAKRLEAKPEAMLRSTFERLGPTFIKFGQLLSVRPDLVPKEYCKELENLQDKVPEFPFSEVKSIIEKEFGKSMEHLFLHFEKKPIASASISQVHRAILKNGEKVAVKVQRPNIRHLIETDIEIMLYFAKLLENNVERIIRYRPLQLVEEFREWTEKELDFRLEARNAKRFAQNFKGSKSVKIPKVYDGLTTEHILTLEFIDGIELHDIKEIKRRKIDFNRIMGIGFEAVMTQVFVHGIFHADPHPGNIMVMRDNSIAFVDFGIVGYFDEKLKNECIDLLYGIAEQDEELVMDALIGIGMESGDIDYGQLKTDIAFTIQPLQGASIRDVKISKVLEELLDIALRHKLRIPASFVLFGKTIITLEGVAIEYDPNFKIIETAKPFIEKVIARRKSPLYMWKSFVHNIDRYRKFAEDFPEKAEKALDRIQRGTIKVDIEDTDIKKLSLEIDRSSNRVAYGLLIASLLIASAILMNIGKGPTILGVPFLSFASFFFASVFALILFMSIVRESFRHW